MLMSMVPDYTGIVLQGSQLKSNIGQVCVRLDASYFTANFPKNSSTQKTYLSCRNLTPIQPIISIDHSKKKFRQVSINQNPDSAVNDFKNRGSPKHSSTTANWKK